MIWRSVMYRLCVPPLRGGNAPQARLSTPLWTVGAPVLSTAEAQAIGEAGVEKADSQGQECTGKERSPQPCTPSPRAVAVVDAAVGLLLLMLLMTALVLQVLLMLLMLWLMLMLFVLLLLAVLGG